MSKSETKPKIESWQPYNLDYYAQELVLNYRLDKNDKNVLNQSHKMRMTVAYGLERFWGEHLRLMRENVNKGKYWKAVWDTLAEILEQGGIILPNDDISSSSKNSKEQETENIRKMAKKIWSMSLKEQRVALMVLTQLCDSLVWWTQRYKIPS